MESMLINALIKRKPGECNHCGYPIGIIERELTDIALNAEGLPIRYEISAYKCIGYCAHCGKTYPNIARRGLYFDIRSLHHLVENNEGGNYDTITNG